MTTMNTANSNNNNGDSRSSRQHRHGSSASGVIPELRGHLFTAGEKDSPATYNTVKEKVAEYCGVAFGSEQYTLIMTMTECGPTPPNRPTTSVQTRSQDPATSATTTDVDMVAYKL